MVPERAEKAVISDCEESGRVVMLVPIDKSVGREAWPLLGAMVSDTVMGFEVRLFGEDPWSHDSITRIICRLTDAHSQYIIMLWKCVDV